MCLKFDDLLLYNCYILFKRDLLLLLFLLFSHVYTVTVMDDCIKCVENLK